MDAAGRCDDDARREYDVDPEGFERTAVVIDISIARSLEAISNAAMALVPTLNLLEDHLGLLR